jgi:hypothetical protein
LLLLFDLICQFWGCYLGKLALIMQHLKYSWRNPPYNISFLNKAAAYRPLLIFV